MAQFTKDCLLVPTLVPSLRTLSQNVLSLASKEPVFKMPAPPRKRKLDRGIACNNDTEPLEPSLPAAIIQQEPMDDAKIPWEEPLIPASCIKLEPIDYEENEEVFTDEFVTADMLGIENKLKKQLERKQWQMGRVMTVQPNPHSVREHERNAIRYNQLMHLFETSKCYSNFMKEKLTDLNIVMAKRVPKNKTRAAPNEERPPETEEKSSKPKRRTKLTQTGSNNIAEVVNEPKPDIGSSKQGCQNGSTSEDGDTYVNAMGLTVSRLQPKLFEGGVLRDYQVDGVEWLKVLDANNISGILADEMGLGKTIQVIALFCDLIGQGIPGPFVVVAPLSTIPNWMAEFKRFAPQIPTVLVHGNEAKRRQRITEFQKLRSVAGVDVHPVVITSFQIPLAETAFFRSVEWRYLVVDEGHRIKNHRTLLAVELKRLDSISRLILTGTPLQNNLAELWSLLNFLQPDIFTDLSSFETWFDCKDLLVKGGEDKILAQEQEKQVLYTMHQILSPFLLRRLKSDVEMDLPPKKERLVFCPLTTTQKQLYSAVLDRSIDLMLGKKPVKEERRGRPKRRCSKRRSGKSYAEAIVINSDDEDEDWRQSEMENLTVTDVEDPTYKLRIRMQQPVMTLRHIVNHPYLVQMPLERAPRGGNMQVRIDEDLVRKSGKMLVLDAILPKLKERGHKVLIFSSFTMMLDLLADFMELRDYGYCHLDGRVTLAVRQEQIRRFNADPDTFVFLISTRAGGLGINLTAADTVITYDSDWNPQSDIQAQDRCHRIGQTRPVMVYRLATEGTVDQVIIERAAAKRKLEKMIIQKDAYSVDTKVNKAQAIDMVALRTLLQSDDFESVLHSNGYVFDDDELEALLDRSSASKKKTKKNK